MQHTVKRKGYIDFLKVIGLLFVILAHVSPPEWIMFIRCFDVPFLVILSAVLSGASERDLQGRFAAGRYAARRFARLVLPTWLFLAFYFLYQFFTGTTHNAAYYLNSFLLTRYGIGYVWIILIYLYCALLTPWLKKAFRFRMAVAWGVVLAAYILFEVAYAHGLGTQNRLIFSTVYYIIPYGCLTALGLQYEGMSRKTRWLVLLVSAALALLAGVYYAQARGAVQLPSIDKYPPRVYFMAYSIAMSFLLLMLCQHRDCRLFRAGWVRYISTHSLWIYLWHIFYLAVIPKTVWPLRFAAVTALSILTIWLQNLLCTLIETRTHVKIPMFLRR